MTTRDLFVIGTLVAVQAAGLGAQSHVSREHMVFAAIDRNGNEIIDEDELGEFLRVAVQARAARAGLSIGPDTPEFGRYVKDLVRSALNHSTADENDEISAAEIAALETTALPAPLGGTIKDLLPETAGSSSSRSWTDHLSDWVDVRKSFLDDQSVGKPATIARTHVGRDDETVAPDSPRDSWAIDASVIMSGFVEWKVTTNLFVRPIAGYEMHVNSSKPENDHVVHHVGADVNYLRPAEALVQSHRLLASVDYSTDRRYAAQVVGATMQYTLNATRLGIGRYLGGGRAVDLRWRPYLGVVLADVKNPGTVKAYGEQTDFRHGFVKITGELRVTPRGLVTPEVVWWRGARADADGAEHHWQAITTINPRWVLSIANGRERASVGLTWTVGRDSPGFAMARQLQLAFAFKF